MYETTNALSVFKTPSFTQIQLRLFWCPALEIIESCPLTTCIRKKNGWVYSNSECNVILNPYRESGALV